MGRHTSSVYYVLRMRSYMCPVTAIYEYVHVAAKLGVRQGGHGPLLGPFPAVQRRRGVCGAAVVAQLNDDLRCWLTKCHIFDGKTVHGMRSSGSIEKPLCGESLRSGMQLAYWKSPMMAKYYMKK